MDFTSLHELLRATYDEMMPLCSHMTGIAKGISGLGALFYIAIRVWASLARAEPIDLFPLLRPFALGFCIMFFPSLVLGTMNTILSPVVKGTEQLVAVQEGKVTTLRAKRDKLKEEALLRDPETAYLVSNELFDAKIEEMGIIGPSDAVTIAGMYAERAAYRSKQWIMKAIQDILEFLFHAVSLIIDTLRTFILIVLSILGPIVFGISVWDGLGGSLSAWFSRYISVYLWLPVSSILTALLTKIQVLMLQKDIAQLADPTFIPEVGSWYYMAFFLIGIIGYTAVPTVAGWIIEAGGGIGAYGRNVNQAGKVGAQKAYTGGKQAAGAGGAAIGNMSGRIKAKLTKR